MKRLIALTLILTLAVAAAPDRYEKYIAKYSQVAVAEMQRTGVPASITLAQGLLESAAGGSELASKSNNHFGIKCHSDWKGRKVYRDDDKSGECFRVYANAAASFQDHSDFLRYRDRYKALFDLDPLDYKAWANGLREAGYATDPGYADKLINLIEKYELYRYDTRSEVLPEPPLEIEKPVEVTPEAGVQEEFRFSLSRTLYEVNGVPCVFVVEGDSLESLAKAYGLFVGELLRFNDISAIRPLKSGERIYLQVKKQQAARGLEKYVASDDGLSMREISQRFGVSLKSLCRMNSLQPDYIPLEGDTILLRRR